MAIRLLHPRKVNFLSLNTQKNSSTYLKYNSSLNLETDNSSFSKCARHKLEIVGLRGATHGNTIYLMIKATIIHENA